MISGKAVVKGGSVYIEELDVTFTKKELNDMSYSKKKHLCGFMDEKELDKAALLDDDCFQISLNIYASLKR